MIYFYIVKTLNQTAVVAAVKVTVSLQKVTSLSPFININKHI